MNFKIVKETLLKIWDWRATDSKALPSLDLVNKQVDIDTIKDNTVIEDFEIFFPTQNKSEKTVKFKMITFKNCKLSHSLICNYYFETCIFENCIFTGSKIHNCEFHRCNFVECLFYKVKIVTTFIDPSSFQFSFNWCWYWSNINLYFFQSLYRNSKDMHQENFAMCADKKFQLYSRYNYLRGRNRSKIKFLQNFFYDYILGYGYGIKNVLAVTLIFVISFAWIIDGHLSSDNNFFQALYYSVVSFTTVGYGDIVPKLRPIPMLITIIFLLFSMIWLAVVTAIIVKRIVK